MCILGVMSLLALFALTAFANTIPAPTINDNIVLCNSNNANCINVAPRNATGAVSFSGSISGGGTTITGMALADATGGPGDLKAFSSYSLSIASSFFSQFQSNAEYWENLTINSVEQPAGSVGRLVISMKLTGTTSASGVGSAGVLWQDSVGTNPVKADLWNFKQGSGNCAPAGLVWQGGDCANPLRTQGSFNGSAILTLDPIDFHFGAPFWVDFALGAGTYPSLSFLSGTTDFSHTASLTGLQVFDENGNLVSNPTFVSGSGLQYSVNGVVPEPASLALLGMGLMAMGVVRYCKR